VKLTDRQNELLGKMADGEWYTAGQLGTNPQCLRKMAIVGLLKRERAIDLGGHRMNDALIRNIYKYKLVIN
jgi:hypothetical protein